MTSRSPLDHAFMTRALAKAAQGRNITTPNPSVGCVIVNQQGVVIGEGHSQPAGQNHAEVEALIDARERGCNPQGTTVYVTLEPCSHFGRTPPCCDALIEAGVARVVVACEDPNPLVSGRGLERLREAGIVVDVGVMAAEAREHHAGFISRMTRGRPFVRLKIAVSLDGKTALANGRSQWITGIGARRDTHLWRARSCAVLTGVGTVLADDPQLNVRTIETPRQPLRIVLDSQLRTPATAKILDGGNTLIVTTVDTQIDNAEILRITASADGRVPLPALLTELGQRGINELMVEAGAQINAAFIQSGLVDEYLIYMAPCLLGDPAHGLAALPEFKDLSEKVSLRFVEAIPMEEDLRIRLRPPL